MQLEVKMAKTAQLIIAYSLGLIGIVGICLSGLGWMTVAFAIVAFIAVPIERDALVNID